MTGCKIGCAHRALVNDYRAERARQEAVADDVSHGYATERAQHLDASPLVTFKQWLCWTRQSAARATDEAAA